MWFIQFRTFSFRMIAGIVEDVGWGKTKINVWMTQPLDRAAIINMTEWTDTANGRSALVMNGSDTHYEPNADVQDAQYRWKMLTESDVVYNLVWLEGQTGPGGGGPSWSPGTWWTKTELLVGTGQAVTGQTHAMTRPTEWGAAVGLYAIAAYMTVYPSGWGAIIPPLEKANPGLFLRARGPEDGSNPLPRATVYLGYVPQTWTGQLQLQRSDSHIGVYDAASEGNGVFAADQTMVPLSIPLNLSRNYIYVEALAPSTAMGSDFLRFSFEDVPEAYDLLRITGVKFGIHPDMNRDGLIDDEDAVMRTNRTFRLWVNDDNDDGDEARASSDLPGQTNGNNKDLKVNGMTDLLDFFPLWLDLSHPLDLLADMSERVEYSLHSSTNNLNVLYSQYITRSNFHSHSTLPYYGSNAQQNAGEASVLTVSPAGLILPDEFLDGIRSNPESGMIFVEATAEGNGNLYLEILLDGKAILTYTLPYQAVPVTNMYRTVNLRGMTTPAIPVEPPGWPDDETNGKDVVFLHGFNTSEIGARIWNAEIFKRLYQSGSNAKFHAIHWKGDDSAWLWDPHYQRNVTNAFATAPHLAAYVNGLSTSVTMMAHSLGNMVVSSALVDHNMRATHYMICSAAVPSEAYDAGMANNDATNNPMVHAEWREYAPHTWAANWHTLFTTNNTRSGLTWQNRFADIFSSNRALNIWNYYSDSDEIFELTVSPTALAGMFNWQCGWPLLNVEGSRHVWQKQEIRKGRHTAVNFIGATQHAGWGFSWLPIQWVEGSSTFDVSPLYVRGVNAIPTWVLRQQPVFRRDVPTWLVGPNDLTQEQINEMLAMGIPALSPALGTVAITSGFGANRQVNLNFEDDFKPNGWPTRVTFGQDWMHNDIRNVAYFYNYKLFDNIVENGDLK